MVTLKAHVPAEVEASLRRLGAAIRMARIRRGLRIVDLAERVGVSRHVMADIEHGKPTTAAGGYVAALWALGLLHLLDDAADPDRDDEGKALERARAPERVRASKELDDDF